MKKKYCRVCKIELFRDVNWYKSQHSLLCNPCDRINRKRWVHRYSKEHFEKVKQYAKSEKGKQATKIGIYNYRRNYPEKYSAHQKVHYAVRIGKLIKDLCYCGEIKVQAHHPDYSKPLQVIWLCEKHHKEIHRNIKYLNQTFI